MPWHWLQGLPILSQVLPDRFAVVADGAAAAVLAFSLDLRALGGAGRSGWARRNWPFAVAALALVPLIPVPLQAGQAAPVPVGWRAAFTRLHLAASAPVLVVPMPYSHSPRRCAGRPTRANPARSSAAGSSGPTSSGQAIVENLRPVRPITSVLVNNRPVPECPVDRDARRTTG